MNNRQNGRRRGRGGQQARNGQPGAPDRGNRLDNRARGNAAQLLEKYKTLARDAQMQGDRVNTEYYLQFADHYFRVLSENRSRFEEQQQRRPEGYRDDYGQDGDEGEGRQQGYQPQQGGNGQSYDAQGDDGWDDGDEGDAPRHEPRAEQRRDQRDDQPRQQQAPRRDREFQPRRERERQPYQGEGEQPRAPRVERAEVEARPANDAAPEAQPRAEGDAPRRGRRPRNAGGAAPQLDLDAEPARLAIDLPPKLTVAAPVADAEGDAAPKKRRTRKPKAETETVEA